MRVILGLRRAELGAAFFRQHFGQNAGETERWKRLRRESLVVLCHVKRKPLDGPVRQTLRSPAPQAQPLLAHPVAS